MTLAIVSVLFLAYLIGSIPFGLIIVHLTSGEDIRQSHSGRTGGTNAWRAAGFQAGLLTALLDITKGALTVVLAKQVPAFARNDWLLIIVPLILIIGNNYSIFTLSQDKSGKLIIGGGAGGAVCLGGAMGLWWPSGLIILAIAIAIYYFVGYASVTTMSIALLAAIIFVIRAIEVGSPWEYVAFALVAELLLMYALRPNIKRLLAGTERLHGYRAKKMNRSDSYSS
jgi:glycerol-3-phosphate acyltransferase PlsY